MRKRDIALEPTIILFGCRPYVPFQPGWHDRQSRDQHYRAPAYAEAGDRPWPPQCCPVCHGRVSTERTCCGLCTTTHAEDEQRVDAQRIASDARERSIDANRKIGHALAKRKKLRLTERERRRIWAGSLGDGLSTVAEIQARRVAGRKWLAERGELPDWSLILDRRGNVIGKRQSDCNVSIDTP